MLAHPPGSTLVFRHASKRRLMTGTVVKSRDGVLCVRVGPKFYTVTEERVR